MIRPDFSRQYSRARATNQVIMVVKDPGRAPAAVRITNADAQSVVSTVSKGATTSEEIVAGRVVDVDTMTDIGKWAVRNADVMAQVASLTTHPDPRRDAHEYYTITVEDQEDASHWQAAGWSLACEPGAQHTHRIGRTLDLNLLVETVV